jgi:hypothetical protein
MKASKLLLALAIAMAVCFIEPAQARTVEGGPSYRGVPVPDTGSTVLLLGSALLAVGALRRKLSR